MAEEIKKLEEVLLPEYLGGKREIVQCNTRRLTAPGENYGSLMLALEIKIRCKNDGRENVLHAVAKAVPRNEFIQKMFKSHLTFKKELELYRTVVPTLKEFQKEQGIDKVVDFFPDYYGGRLGLGPNFETFDNDAVILLENLKHLDYKCVDRTKGFDLEIAKFIIRDLAAFHAIPIALKLKKPQLFNKNILPFLNDVIPFSNLERELLEIVTEGMARLAGLKADCTPYLDKFKNKMHEAFGWSRKPKIPTEPFATAIHCDFWVNNIMIKTEGDEVVATKIVDFQATEYGSPTRDLLFFIFVSVQNDVVVNEYDQLVKFYHQCFTEVLKQFDVDTTLFSFDAFENEINSTAKEAVLCQCVFMLKPIFASEDSVKEVEDLSQDDMRNLVITQGLKEKLWMIITEFAKRNWL